MIINLTPEIEAALIEQARQLGTTPELLALDSLRERFVPPSEAEATEPEGTLADFLADHIGVLHSSEFVPDGAGMSEDCGRKFSVGMKKKQDKNRL